MKIHVFAGVAVGIAGGELVLSTAARLALVVCVMLVVSAEALNSALESLVDLHTKELQHEARRVKDAAAAAVLVLSIGSLLVAATVLGGSWDELVASLPRLRADAPIAAAILLLTAGLLVPRHRPATVDALGAGIGVALLVVLALRSLSLPLTVMAGGLFALAAASAWSARALRSEADAGRAGLGAEVAGVCGEARSAPSVERTLVGRALAARAARRER